MTSSNSNNKMDGDEDVEDAAARDTSSSLPPPLEYPPTTTTTTFSHDETSPMEPLLGSKAAAATAEAAVLFSPSVSSAWAEPPRPRPQSLMPPTTFSSSSKDSRRNSSSRCGSSNNRSHNHHHHHHHPTATTPSADDDLAPSGGTLLEQRRRRRRRQSRSNETATSTTPSSSVRRQQQQPSGSSSSCGSSVHSGGGGGGGGEPTVVVPPPPSWQDRLSSTALTATLEVLKQVGGVTLSTTGALVAPPWHVTKTILLPNLWMALRDGLRSASPVRFRDWWHIVRRSFYHIVHTIRHTTSGQHFQHRLCLVGIDLVECLSAETTRQCLVDGMGTAVKLAEALHTPEVETLLQQVAVTACRVVEAASNGHNQRLMHDLSQAVWSACTLLADPATTTALAEITANLCYALEMEQQQQQLHYNNNLEQQNSTTSSLRRHERNQYQRAVADKDTIRDTAAIASVTVEQVILSSLGDKPNTKNNTNDDDEHVVVDRRNVPDSIAWEKHTTSTTPVMTNVSGSNKHDHQHHNPEWDPAAAATSSSSIRQQKQQHVVKKGEPTPKDDAASIASSHKRKWKSNKVDVEFLLEAIEQRAVHVQAAQQKNRTLPKGLHSVSTQPPPPPPPMRNESGEDDAANETKDDDGDDDDDYCDTDVEELGVVTTVDDDVVVDGSGSCDDDRVGDETTKRRRRRQRRRRQLATLNATFHAEDGENDVVERKDTVVGFTNQQLPHDGDEACESPSPAAEHKIPHRLQDETAVQHFYRILDEIMLDKRNNTVRATLTPGGYHRTTTGGNENGADFFGQSKKAGIVRRPNRTRTDHDTVKSRLEAIRAELGTVVSKQDLEQLNRVSNKVPDNKVRRAVMVGLSVVLLFVLFWFGLGCYGLYVYFHPVASRGALSAPSLPNLASQEIVIRVVKEVVHVNQDGKELGRGKWNVETEVTADEYQKVAECVAAVYN